MTLNWRDRSLYFGIIAFGIPFSIPIGNLFLFLGGAGLLFLTFRQKGFSFKNTTLSLAWGFPILFFFLVLTSALFSGDVAKGLVQVDKHLIIALYGLLFFFGNPVTREEYESTFKAFSTATLLVCLMLLLAAIIRFLSTGDFGVFFFFEFGSLFDLHPVYIAINLVIASLFVIHHYGNTPFSRKGAVLFVGVQLIFVLGLLLCASKAVLGIYVILVSIELLRALKGNLNRILAVIIIGILLSGSMALPQLQKRFMEGMHFDLSGFKPDADLAHATVFTNEAKANISDVELRYLLWRIGLFHWGNDEVYLFGYGIGDVQHYLDYYYMYYGLAPSWFEGYNLHNQYLQYLVTYGLVGLGVFLAYLLVSFRRAIQSGNRLHLYFLILISSIFIFECLLSRNKGLAIVYFINTIFLSRNYTK